MTEEEDITPAYCDKCGVYIPPVGWNRDSLGRMLCMKCRKKESEK